MAVYFCICFAIVGINVVKKLTNCFDVCIYIYIYIYTHTHTHTHTHRHTGWTKSRYTPSYYTMYYILYT